MVRPFRRGWVHDFCERAGGKKRADGADARRSRARRRERSGEPPEQVGFGTSGGEGETHPAGCLDDAGGDLDQAQTQSGELGPRQVARRGNGVADSEHQPIGASVQDEAHLIGDWRPARRAMGGKLRLVQLDQVLGLTARAIKAVVKPLRRPMREIGDDEADVETEPRRLDASDGAAFSTS